MAHGPIAKSFSSDFLNLFKKKKKKKKKKPSTVKEYDSAGRPVGVGGYQRRKSIDEYVDQAQSGKKKK